MQVPLRLAVIRRIHGLPILSALIRPTPVSKVTAKDEQLARLQFARRPRRFRDPFRLDAIVLSVDGDVHSVAAADDYKAAVSHRGGVNGEENSEVFDFPDVRVGG